MMPLTMMGSLIGAFFYLLLPEMVILIILTLLLCVLTIESGKKFLQIYRKENQEMENKNQNQTEIVHIEKEMNEEKIDFNQNPEISTDKKLKDEVDSAR